MQLSKGEVLKWASGRAGQQPHTLHPFTPIPQRGLDS